MQEYTYDAFISYRHIEERDKPIAEYLQKLLENYRPPRSVKKKKIGKIFRDKTDLPLVNNLDEGITLALQQSRWLIIVCSKRYQDSKYCMRELEYFKELHGGKTDAILTLLIEGDPREVFPEALLRDIEVIQAEDGTVLKRREKDVEPLCADVRAKTLSEARKLLRKEFLRIAAPMHGCSFDDLYRRHLQRRRRRLTGVGAVASFAAAGFFAYNAYMNQQIIRQKQDNALSKAATIAGYVDNLLKEDDTLLAMMLTNEALIDQEKSEKDAFLRQPAAEAAQRSAVLQRRYADLNLPVSRRMTVSYGLSYDSVYYFVGDNDIFVIARVNMDGSISLYDTKTGMEIGDASFDSVKLYESADRLFRFHAYRDDDGKLYDAFTVYALSDGRELHTELMCEAGTSAKKLTLIYDPSQPKLIVRDLANGEELGRYNFDGIPLEIGALASVPAPAEASTRPVQLRTFGSRASKDTWAVRAETEERLYKLPPKFSCAELSDDCAYLSYYDVDAREIVVVSLAGGEVLFTKAYTAPTDIEGAVKSIHTFEDGSFLLISYDEYDRQKEHGGAERYRYEVIDNLCGEVVNAGYGELYVPKNAAWFLVGYKGVLSRYDLHADVLPQSDNLRYIRYSESGGRLLAARDGYLQVVDTETAEVLFQAPIPENLYDADEALQTLASCTKADGLVVASQDKSTSFPLALSDEPAAIAVNGRAGRVAIGDQAGNIHIYDMQTGQAESLGGTQQDAIVHLQYRGELLLSVHSSGALVVRDLAGVVLTLENIHVNTEQCPALLLSDDLLIAYNDEADLQNFSIWHIGTKRQVFVPDFGVASYDFTPDGKILVVQPLSYGGRPVNELCLYQINEKGVCEQRILPLAYAECVFHLDATGRYLSIQDMDGTKVYDVDTFERWLNVYGTYVQMQGGKAMISPDYAARGASFCLLDTPSADSIHTYSEHELTSPNGTRILTSQERAMYPYTQK